MKELLIFFALVASAAAQGFGGQNIQGSTLGAPVLTPVSIAVSPASATLFVGPGNPTQFFTAQVTYSNSTTGDVTSLATWSASPTTYTTQTSSSFTCIAAGSTTITATYLALTPATATLTCQEHATPTVTTNALPNGNLNVPYTSTQLQATGGTPPYYGGTAPSTPPFWTETGTLPSGMSFNRSTGTLSGTPTVSGNFSLTFTVTDSANQTSPAVVLALPVIVPPTPGNDDNQYCTTSSSTDGNNLTTWSTTYPNGATMDGPATLPRKCVNTALSQSDQSRDLDTGWTSGKRIITICPASVASCDYSDLQLAMNDLAKASTETLPHNYIGYSVGCGVTVKIYARDGSGNQLTYADGAASGSTWNGPQTADVSGGYGNPQPIVCPPNGWVIFETDQLANSNFPPEGTRITPAAVGVAALHDYPGYTQNNNGSTEILVPKIMSNGPPYYDGTHLQNCPAGGCVNQSAITLPAMSAKSGADTICNIVGGVPQVPSHLRFTGIEFTSDGNSGTLVQASKLQTNPNNNGGEPLSGGGPNGSGGTWPSCGPTNIIFDRVLAHCGNAWTSTNGWSPMECHIGISVGSGSAIVNSYINQIWVWSGNKKWYLTDANGVPPGGTGYIATVTGGMFGNNVDAQAASALWGGPIKFVNNFLEAASEPYWTGLGHPSPTDVEIRRNHSFHAVYSYEDSVAANDYFCGGGGATGLGTVTIANGGSNYTVGDTLKITQNANSFGGVILVASTSSGAISTFTTSSVGIHYNVANGLATTCIKCANGSATGATVNITTTVPVYQDSYPVSLRPTGTAGVTGGYSYSNCPNYGQHVELKNGGESKSEDRVLYEGNIIDQSFPGADQPASLNLLHTDNQAEFGAGQASTDGAGNLSGISAQFVYDLFSPNNQLSGQTTGCQPVSNSVASQCDPTAPLH